MSTPLLGLVVPIYNVAPYIGEFLASLEAQTYPLSEVQLVFVDDGSTDGSSTMLERWCRSAAPWSTVVSQPNAGLSAARNAGLARVGAEWVTFCDPDDTLAPDYLGRVAAFLSSPRSQGVNLACTNVLILDDTSRQLVNRHPLRFRFTAGTHVVDLDHHPNYIHLQAASGFYRRSEIERRSLTFDSRVVPNFEDAFFTARFLADKPHPLVALLADARYHYRRRAGGDSLTQGSWASPDKYTTLPRQGYLTLARELAGSDGRLPTWVQNLLLYDLFWYLKEDHRQHSPTAAVPREVAQEFHETVHEILTYIEAENIEGFSVVPTPLAYRLSLIIGYKDADLRPRQLHIHRVDADQVIAQVRYHYGGALPDEEFRSRGRPVRPVHQKIRDITLLGRVLMHERIVWLPADGTIRIALDGHAMPLVLGPEPDPIYVVRPAQMWRRLTSRRSPPRLVPAARSLSVTGARGRPDHARSLHSRFLVRARQTAASTRSTLRGGGAGGATTTELRAGRALLPDKLTDVWVRRLARSPLLKRRFVDAWVFMDRDDQAQDNAEHLYRYVHDVHPETNAWFVLQRESPDWPRLRREGFRLVRFGSTTHTLLLLNAVHVLSSQVDHYVVQPLDPARFGPKRWRFTFLQHGVTKDDLSRWVDSKPISLFVTATMWEYDSIAGDHTPYVFTSKEVRLTGFPRHDRLLRLGRDPGTGRPRILLVMPTWRNGLVHGSTSRGNARSLRPGFLESEYAQEWFGLLSSLRLREIAEQHGLEIVFVPHPNVGDLPAAATGGLGRVTLRRSTEVDLQALFAQAAILVTDYSSVAFEVAYLERPVVYFQFDQPEFFGGLHVYRQSSWRYESNGFGPVTTTAEDALAAIGRAASHGGQPEAVYAERMRAAFAFRDGGCCERTYREVVRLTRPVTYEEAYGPSA